LRFSPPLTLTTILRASFWSTSRKNLMPSVPVSAPFFLPWNGCASTSDNPHHWT
jgi:hypothetical protein